MHEMLGQGEDRPETFWRIVRNVEGPVEDHVAVNSRSVRNVKAKMVRFHVQQMKAMLPTWQSSLATKRPFTCRMKMCVFQDELQLCTQGCGLSSLLMQEM